MSLTISAKCAQIAPSLTLAIDAKAKEMKAQGLPVIGFGAGEPDFDTPSPICKAAKKALDVGMTRYTPVAGIMDLRQAICKKLKKDNGLAYTPDQIIVSSGAKHSLFTIFQTIIDPGDEVIIPTPCWVSYPEMVRMAGGNPVFVETREADGFIPTRSELESAVTPKTKAIIITSPSNPNGCVYSREVLQMIGDIAVQHDFFIVSDEIYEKLIYDGQKHVSIASLGEAIKARTLLVNGVSKAYAMTGWRIGYTAGPANVIKAMVTFQSQATSNANSIAQYASITALNGDQECVEIMRHEFERRRDYMVTTINGMRGLSCLKPAGAFYIMMNVTSAFGTYYNGKKIETSMDFAAALLEKKQVAVVPGVAFMAEGYVRLSYAISLPAIEEGMARIADFMKELHCAA